MVTTTPVGLGGTGWVFQLLADCSVGKHGGLLRGFVLVPKRTAITHTTTGNSTSTASTRAPNKTMMANATKPNKKISMINSRAAER